MAWNAGYQVWLTEAQSLENAQLVINHLAPQGWTGEALAALCGNMRHESSINPDMYEYGYDWSADRGYGLVQWTPRSKYWNWATARGLTPNKGESQLSRIDYEVEQNIQWIPTAEFNYMTFAEFRSNAGNWSVDYLTAAFTWGYERPNRQAGENSMASRRAFAQRVYNELDLTGAPGGGDPGGGGTDPTPRPGKTDKGGLSTVVLPASTYETEEVIDGMTYYKVKKGDTLSGIARNGKVKMSDIKRVRYVGIGNADNLDVGEVLLLPKAASAAPKPATPKKPKIHVVASGDTLGAIAKKYGVSVNSLATKNNIKNPNKIYPGQVIKI